MCKYVNIGLVAGDSKQWFSKGGGCCMFAEGPFLVLGPYNNVSARPHSHNLSILSIHGRN